MTAQNWTASELIARIKEDNKPIGFYVDWMEYIVMAEAKEALSILNRFPPSKMFKVRMGVETICIFGWGEK